MCGIVGFTGAAQAAPILLDGLAKLEYRGYDSAGIAVQNAAGKIEIVKAKGRLRVLSDMTDGGRAVQGTCGIGHTRWATHGEPSVQNAHPHYSRDEKIAVVHNGIIENFQELKDRLINRGYEFASQTDTEVVAQLIDYYYTGEAAGDPLRAITSMMMHVRGSYALGVLFADRPGVVYAVRKDSPLIVGRAENGSLIASDVPALLKYTRTVYYIDNLEIACLTPDSITFYNIDREQIEKQPSTIEWDAEAAEKGGYEHFMMKEIHEQPAAVRDTISPRIKDGRVDLSELSLDEDALRAVRRVYIVGCGSAYHVGVAARYVMESLARLPVEVDVASEFRYRDPVLEPDSLAIIISQSGETADTLAALRLCKERGVRTIGIVNVVGSSIAREADATLYTWAGPEIAVATTKAYSTQLAACYLLAIAFGQVRGTLDDERAAALVAELQALPEKIEKTLQDKERIQWFASKYANAHDAFFIGRGLDYAVALEGSLKFKEISYIHSEAFAAGEMKHGPISLVEKNTLVVGILTQPDLYEKTVSNLVEARSRGAFLMGLTSYGNYSIEDTAGFTVYVPRTEPCFATSLAVIPLQLLAYYVSCAKGLDVDKPRNLAKSVTVE
ncbi:MAG TPA: glutamine--fructose-6-phosphate transaminase (isomerizing) [Candidatus Gemmiger stercoripullorum]|nr:glutamine--fructose-6-phosphate transaminase (isomerizing) [Candidatus Gemmiger stercoripullorum]